MIHKRLLYVDEDTTIKTANTMLAALGPSDVLTREWVAAAGFFGYILQEPWPGESKESIRGRWHFSKPV